MDAFIAQGKTLAVFCNLIGSVIFLAVSQPITAQQRPPTLNPLLRRILHRNGPTVKMYMKAYGSHCIANKY